MRPPSPIFFYLLKKTKISFDLILKESEKMAEHKIIAHRGMSTLAPENTMAAFELMPKYHINWLETDLAITNDEKLVIMHDGDIARTTNGHGRVTAMNFEELHRLSAGAWFDLKFKNEKIPTFDEVIDFINQNQINLNLEIKPIGGNDAARLTRSMIRQLAQKLDRIDSRIRVIISSFYPDILMKMKQVRPDLEYACLFNQFTLSLSKPLTGLLNTKIVHPDNRRLTASKVKRLKEAGYEVNVWTVDKIDRANQLFNWGVDGIFTDIGQDFPTHHQGNIQDSHYLTTWF